MAEGVRYQQLLEEREEFYTKESVQYHTSHTNAPLLHKDLTHNHRLFLQRQREQVCLIGPVHVR